MSIELKQAAQQAVDAFDAFGDADDFASLFELTQKMRALSTAIQQAEAQQPAQATQAEVTDAEIEALFGKCGGHWSGDQWVIEDADLHPFARAILALRPEQSGLTGCNCRWDGDTQVQWCELHLAHKEAIHEWAERAKEAEKQLTRRPAAVPMTEDQVWHNDALMSANGTAGFKMDALMRIVRATEAHHGITAQTKKEAP